MYFIVEKTATLGLFSPANSDNLTRQRNLQALFSSSFFLCHVQSLRVARVGLRVIKKDYFRLTTRNTQLVTRNTYVITKQTSLKNRIMSSDKCRCMVKNMTTLTIFKKVLFYQIKQINSLRNLLPVGI